jgi:hypothetical protein
VPRKSSNKSADEPKAGGSVRTPLPDAVRREVLMESGYKCARPQCSAIITLQIHHMIYVRDGGENDPSNLLPLCGYCHDMHHAGHFPTEAIRLWKGLLAALNNAFDRKTMDLLLYLSSTSGIEEVWYTGDGLLAFASLIAAGLARFESQDGSMAKQVGTVRVPFNYHRVWLTEKGSSLVHAWRNGDEQAFRKLVESRED